MRLSFRATAWSAAALSLCAAGGLAAPSIAAQDFSPAVAYADHAGSSLTAESLGLNDLADPAPRANPLETFAPVATHAVATPTQRSILDQGENDDQADGRSLDQLVSDYAGTDTADAEGECLARAVYWESKGEPLAGQLTVAEVIINRAESGRFASTICGVVRQRGQFSFVRGGNIPQAREGSRDWRVAVAIAHIAQQDLAEGSAPRALFFHARRVNPGWRLTRVATVGNHVFYR
jgi:spore germination cell wall hydrolase CwlJ-like protein